MARTSGSETAAHERPSPKYSIVIPTRNGLKYLKFAIDSVLSEAYDDFELIVSDNCSTDGTAHYLSTLGDTRLRCIRPASVLSMAAHFEFAMSHAKGEWITSIGDDDGLIPGFFQKFDDLEPDTKGVNAVVFERAYYFWENCEDLYGDAVVSYNVAGYKDRVRSKFALFLCVASLINYIELPQLYTSGMVRRSYYDRIKATSGGKFFFGPTPDASSAAVLALNTSRHLRVGSPLFWTGTSTKSTGFSQSSICETSRATEFDQLNKGENKLRSDKIPVEILNFHDFAVILYEAILLQRSAGWIWSSKFMYFVFMAGLARKSDQMREVVLNLARKRTDKAMLKIATLVINEIEKRAQKSLNRNKTFVPEFSINSNDRLTFGDILKASLAVKNTYGSSAL